MTDQSYLDSKYFITVDKYNCPYCNRRHVSYRLRGYFDFDWDNDKECHGYIAICDSCGKRSLHLSWGDIPTHSINSGYRISTENPFEFEGKEVIVKDIELDELFFYHQPTSFFTVDNRIPRIIRELITEAEDCRKMNFLTGGSACLRKAIYELLNKEQIKVDLGDYETRIKALKNKFTNIKPEYFDALVCIKDMTSDKIHEESWKNFDSPSLNYLIETVKAVLYEIYVEPEEKKSRLDFVQKLKQRFAKDKKEQDVSCEKDEDVTA